MMQGCLRDKNKEILFYGYFETDYVYVASPFSGILMDISVKKGDAVKNGSVLFSLESAEEEAALAKYSALLAEAKEKLEDMNKGERPEEIAASKAYVEQQKAVCELSEIEFKRAETLMNKDSIARKDYDSARLQHARNLKNLAEAEAKLETAKLPSREDLIQAQQEQIKSFESEISNAKWKLSRKTMSAPLDASVFDVLYRKGEFVPAGKPVLSLFAQEYLKLRFFVHPSAVSKMKIGDKVSFKISGDNKTYQAAISYISPEAEYNPPVIFSRENRERLCFMLEAVPLPSQDGNFHPGMPLEVLPAAVNP